MIQVRSYKPLNQLLNIIHFRTDSYKESRHWDLIDTATLHFSFNFPASELVSMLSFFKLFFFLIILFKFFISYLFTNLSIRLKTLRPIFNTWRIYQYSLIFRVVTDNTFIMWNQSYISYQLSSSCRTIHEIYWLDCIWLKLYLCKVIGNCYYLVAFISLLLK